MKFFVFLASLLVFTAPAAFGHGDEDHGAPAPVVTQSVAPRATSTSEEFEAVAVFENKKLVLYLDRFASNEPVVGAKVEIEGGGLKGAVTESSPGVYVIDAISISPAKHPLTISIEVEDDTDLLSATLDLAPSQAGVEHVRGWSGWSEWPVWLGAGVLALVGGVLLVIRHRKQQRIHKLATIIAVVTLAFAAKVVFAHGDEDHGQDNKKISNAAAATTGLLVSDGPQRLADGSLFVPKPIQRKLGIRTSPVRNSELAATVDLNGKVIPNPDAGGRIQVTQFGSVLPGPKGMPVPGLKVSKGEVLAYLRPAGSAIERGNQQAQLAELEAEVAISESRVKRYEQLEGAIPQKEIEAAKIEHDALQKRRTFVSASVNADVPLIAPVSGVISAGNIVAGQVVETKEILFEIVDPERLSVEALAYDASLASSIIGASALADNSVALDLKFIGGGRQLREQALPLLFHITTRNASVAVGQPVKVMVRTARGIQGAAVSRQALTKVDSGEAAVWVHTEAERFVARKVRVESLDTTNVAITEGLHDGDRVVTEGANLLSQVR